jgi:nucleotide-binding universal stress UspA family protein
MKVLVPIDGSKYSTESIKVASHYAKAKNAETYLITVISSIADIDLELSASERDRLLESMKARGEELLAKAKGVCKSCGVGVVNTVLATSPSPAQEIVSFAEKEKVDLIVIGSRGMNANARFHIGSTMASVVSNSHCCVHVVKEPCWANAGTAV